MGRTEWEYSYHISKNRLKTIVDAIFAFDMTLLAIGIQVPQALQSQVAVELVESISKLLPQLVLFVIAFLVLIIFLVRERYFRGHEQNIQG